MNNEYNMPILRDLYQLGCINTRRISNRTVLRKFPSKSFSKAKEALQDLIQRGYILSVSTQNGDMISISLERINDVKRLIDPDPSSAIKDHKPIEDLVPDEYQRNAFFTAIGSHASKGVKVTYSYHRKKVDPESILVILTVDGKKKGTINLGSPRDPNSLYRKSLEGIDKLCGQTIFTKAKLNELGYEIVGNRQRPRAIIDAMKCDGFVIEPSDNHYQRTSKSIPDLLTPTTIDDFMTDQKKVEGIQDIADVINDKNSREVKK